MPAAPTLPTSISGGSSGHLSHSGTVHGIVNGIYKIPIGATQTGNFTLTQASSGEVIPVSSASSVAVTVPSLEAGTTVEIVRTGTGAVTLTASGVSLLVPTGSVATPRAQYSAIVLLWLTSSTVLVSGDLS